MKEYDHEAKFIWECLGFETFEEFEKNAKIINKQVIAKGEGQNSTVSVELLEKLLKEKIENEALLRIVCNGFIQWVNNNSGRKNKRRRKK